MAPAGRCPTGQSGLPKKAIVEWSPSGVCVSALRPSTVMPTEEKLDRQKRELASSHAIEHLGGRSGHDPHMTAAIRHQASHGRPTGLQEPASTGALCVRRLRMCVTATY